MHRRAYPPRLMASEIAKRPEKGVEGGAGEFNARQDVDSSVHLVLGKNT